MTETSPSSSSTNGWTAICAINDIPPLGSRVLKRQGHPNIAIFRTAQDEVFALLDRCPHKGGPLSQGIVHGSTVTCPLHSWNIDLASGEARAPDVGCAPRIAVKLDAGTIYLELDV